MAYKMDYFVREIVKNYNIKEAVFFHTDKITIHSHIRPIELNDFYFHFGFYSKIKNISYTMRYF